MLSFVSASTGCIFQASIHFSLFALFQKPHHPSYIIFHRMRIEEYRPSGVLSGIVVSTGIVGQRHHVQCLIQKICQIDIKWGQSIMLDKDSD